MGIKGLFKFLRKKNLIKDYQLNQLACKKCAFDISSYIYKFKAIDPKNWMKLLVNFLTTLKQNRIITLVIFDGIAPSEKQNEQKKRQDRRTETKDKVTKLKEATEEYMQTGVENELLKEIKEKRTDMQDLDDIVKYTEKLERQNVNITPEDWNSIRKILQIFNISWIRAEGEAECMCSLLAIRGNVDFVLSEDSDNLAYGCPILISKLSCSTGKCECVILREVLDTLGLTKQQFIDYCILCGTDYNVNISLISNVKALDLIVDHGSLDNLYIDEEYKQKLDKYIPNFVNIRHLFNPFDFKFIEGKVNSHFSSLVAEQNSSKGQGKITLITMENLKNIDKKLDELNCDYFPVSISKIDDAIRIQLRD